MNNPDKLESVNNIMEHTMTTPPTYKTKLTWHGAVVLSKYLVLGFIGIENEEVGQVM